MPSETFLRLPEEKKERLMEAAWEEFTAFPIHEVSINKIIQGANIPRGSFYQYFSDKSDLFSFLVRPLQHHFFDLARQEVERSGGSLFTAPLAIYDRFFQTDAHTSLNLARCLKIVHRNPDSEFRTLFCGPNSPMGAIITQVDTSQLARTDAPYVQEVFHLFILTLASAIIDAMNAPERRDVIRQQLALRIEILMGGCAAPAAQGGTP